MLNNGPGHPGLPQGGPQEAELVLSRLITTAVVVESLAGELAGQVAQARMIRILLLAQEMEQRVQKLRALAHAAHGKNIHCATWGIVMARLPH